MITIKQVRDAMAAMDGIDKSIRERVKEDQLEEDDSAPEPRDPDVVPPGADTLAHRVEHYECFICSKTSWRFIGNSSILCYACDIGQLGIKT